ncbi:hypothetical protein ODJ79_45025 [Actinoplanes sp. KI2]|uniref:hypothetical protein n=1 Tax=Actinoplanes sp. KI2 TaxID=2983315 RepID=UPI0021D5D2DF|nr:hypothetical protein [Actinoplanes sp. KI2]MCU7730923.1 hypothetical protein [Actinoplanes sp. KI2]
MSSSTVLTALVAALAALGGVATTNISDYFKDKRRINHDLEVKKLDRVAAESSRRRTFELENLHAAYDAMYLLMRDLVKIHTVSVESARTTGLGYGSARLPEGTTADLESRSRAAKTIQLILDDNIRKIALDAQTAMTEVATMGARAKFEGRPPVSVDSGESAWTEAGRLGIDAMELIADRIRTLMQENVN